MSNPIVFVLTADSLCGSFAPPTQEPFNFAWQDDRLCRRDDSTMTGHTDADEASLQSRGRIVRPPSLGDQPQSLQHEAKDEPPAYVFNLQAIEHFA